MQPKPVSDHDSEPNPPTSDLHCLAASRDSVASVRDADSRSRTVRGLGLCVIHNRYEGLSHVSNSPPASAEANSPIRLHGVVLN
jgi:hypothetical protein